MQPVESKLPSWLLMEFNRITALLQACGVAIIQEAEQVPDSENHGANVGPIWGWQDPGGPHVGPMNSAIWGIVHCTHKIYFALAGEIWAVFCKGIDGTWPCYNKTTLYLTMLILDAMLCLNMELLTYSRSEWGLSNLPLFTVSILTVLWTKRKHCCHPLGFMVSIYLTHWSWDKMDTILQKTFSNAISWMKTYGFHLQFHWILLPRVQLTIFQHWFREWIGAVQATSHDLNQSWSVYNANVHYAASMSKMLSYFEQTRMCLHFTLFVYIQMQQVLYILSQWTYPFHKVNRVTADDLEMVGFSKSITTILHICWQVFRYEGLKETSHEARLLQNCWMFG